MARPYWTRDFSVEEILEEFKKYQEHNKKELVKNWYWKEVKKPLSITWFCIWLWKGKNYVVELDKDKSYKGAITYIKTIIENDVAEWWMLWIYNPAITAKNLWTNFDWRDKVDNNLNVTWVSLVDLHKKSKD